MQVKCGKCRKEFETSEELVVKKGPLNTYYSCPNCNKIVTVTNQQEVLQDQGNFENEKNIIMEIPGWLIVHDESVRPQTFDLKEGKNIIGRRSSQQVDIAIDTEDMTMSRQHCVLDIVSSKKTGGYDFFINDFKSTNGTIINGKVERKLNEQDVIILNDGDTFQLGMTKIVFRKNNEIRKKDTVVREVLNQPYMPTVVISKDQIRQVFKNLS